MPERRDVILGAGLAGLSAAHTLQNAGQPEWQVYERNAEPGGLARTVEVNGYRFDYGPHILFTIDDEIRELILSGASSIELRQQAIQDGMITLRGSGLQKIRDGITTIDEVVRESIL